MKLRVLFKLILAVPWLGLMVPFLSVAEPLTQHSYYSIQVLSGAPVAVKNAWQKAQGLPFLRIEKHADQHKLRIGFWNSKEEAESQLTKIKNDFPSAFVFVTEFRPNEILQGWSADIAKPAEKMTKASEPSAAGSSGLAATLPAPSNIISLQKNTQPGARSSSATVTSGLVKSLPAPSNIISLQKSTQSSFNAQPDVNPRPNVTVAEESRAVLPAEPAVPSPVVVTAALPGHPRKQAALPDETPLWQLLNDEQYDVLQTELNRVRAVHASWQPPQELLSLLQQGKLRQKVSQAMQNKDATALIQLAEMHPDAFACAHVDWVWALAEAQAALQQSDALLLSLYRLIPDCSEQDRLATLYKAKAWLDAATWEALLAREAQTIRTTEGESKFQRLRYDHAMEKLLAAYQTKDQITFRALFLQLADDIERYRDTDAASLGGWYYFNAQETATAALWFNKALTWNPEQHDARRGLALSALQDKRFADALRYAQEMPAGSEGKQELLHDVATAMAPGPRLLGMTGAESNPGNSAAYAGVILPIHSRLGGLGNGLVGRLWVDRLTYTYNSGEQVVHAEQKGMEGSLGYQKSGAWGSWATFLGAVYRDTKLSPDDPANPARGGHLRGRVQIEGERILNKDWRVNINANFVTGQDSYWVRGRLLHSLSERMRAGPEIITLGDPNFQIMQYGWAMMGLRVLGGMDVTMRSGARKAQEGTTIYMGLELARPF